jgi:hypothetical protein
VTSLSHAAVRVSENFIDTDEFDENYKFVIQKREIKFVAFIPVII